MADNQNSQKKETGHYLQNSENQGFYSSKESSSKKDEVQNDDIKEDESLKVEQGSEVESSVQKIENEQVESHSELTLKKVKSSEELIKDFQQNEKILCSLSTDINSLFKKISSLTEQVTTQLPSLKNASNKHLPIQKNKDSVREKPNMQRQIPKYEKKKEQPLNFEHIIASNPFYEQYKKPNQSGISMCHFQTGQSSGFGKYGEVLTCKNIETGGIFALKKIFKSTIEKYEMQDQLLTELTACKRLKHPNIVKGYSSFTDDFHIFLIMEYAPGKKLTKLFKSEEKKVKKIIRKVAESVSYMHQEGVVHRDLKPQNIIILEQEKAKIEGMIKICDFGWSHLLENGQFMDIICGTLDYVCPQMVKKQKYTKEVDLWSIGILTFELLYGYPPFKGQNREQTFKRVQTIDLKFPEDIQSTPESIDFIKKLLQPEQKRMRMKDALQHDFIKSEMEAFTLEEDIVDSFSKYQATYQSQNEEPQIKT